MGHLDAALKPRHMKFLERELEWLHTQNYQRPVRLVDRGHLSEVISSLRYIGGLVDEGNGHLHPMNLCLGEAEAAENQGVQFFEQSAVMELKTGETSNKNRALTEQGCVCADFVVLCGNTYPGHLEPRLKGKILPAGSYFMATEPLPEALQNEILPGNHAVCDQNVLLDYFRLSAGGRLLFGGRCNYSGRDPKNISKTLMPRMTKVFPQLENVTIHCQWGGWIGMTANRIPQIGRLSPSVYYAQGYSGQGVNATHMAGGLIAGAISGQASGFDVFGRISHRRFSGGRYLRSPMLATGMLWYRLLDFLP